MNQFSNKKILALLVLVVIFLVQTSFVLAAGAPDGSFCDNDSDCESNTCCCCDKRGGADCVSPESGVCGNTNCTNIVCPFSSHRSLYSLVTTISNYIFYIGLILAPLMIVIGAFLFMAAGGSPERAQLGKRVITWALVGLGFILFAKGVASIIGDILFG